MSPEQALGHNDQIDAQTDIYGLGATFFELLTGHSPHHHDHELAKMEAVDQVTSVCCGSTCDSETSLSILNRIGLGPSPNAQQSNSQVPDELNSICADDLENWLVQSDVSVNRWFRRNSNATPVQAELLLSELRSFEPDELDSRIEHFIRQRPNVRDSFRLRLMRLDRQPEHLLPLLRTIDPDDIDRLSLFVHAIDLSGPIRESTVDQYDIDQFVEVSRAAAAITVAQRRNSDDDPGVHSSATWLLQRWGRKPERDTRVLEQNDPKRWFYEKHEHLMVVIPGPVKFDMGSRIPPKITGTEETFHHRTIDRSFAISSHEVTYQQFARFLPHSDGDGAVFYSQHPNGTLNKQAPINHVSWYRAVGYCNWLSKEAGLPEDQWCYLPNERGEYGTGMKTADDFLKRTGYRLPTEAEWEYAARAGSVTPQFFGWDPTQLAHYARYRTNSDIRTWTIGSVKPNELGLFDVYGNVWEWCHGSRDEPRPTFLETVGDEPGELPLSPDHPRALRGGAFILPSGAQRSAIRSFNRPTNEQFTIGFRVSRTLNSVNAQREQACTQNKEKGK